MNSFAKPSPLVMQERIAPSRPSRLGTRRRARASVPVLPEAGASRLRKTKAASLDTEKVLIKTTVREWAQTQQTYWDQYGEQLALHRQLLSSAHALWQKYETEKNGPKARKWFKQWEQLFNCQKQWVVYRAACCETRTASVGVPIGCNHRLCPLCAWHRSQKARKRIKVGYDRLSHPTLITLTIPNTETIRKHNITLMRQRVRQFVAQHSAWIRGGVYSLETTYNRKDHTWHLHVHVLADVKAPLPSTSGFASAADETFYGWTGVPFKPELEVRGGKVKVELAGRKEWHFNVIKLRLEFDWLRLWTTLWSKRPAKNASTMRWAGDTYQFVEWAGLARDNRVKEYDYRRKCYVPIAGLTKEEFDRRTEWNVRNRRTVDVKPVIDRDGAAREVLKYITKVADFSDYPELIEPFCDAVRGARLIQTFGSWYGIKLDELCDHNSPADWDALGECDCGCKQWKRQGIFYRENMAMDSGGRWRLKASMDSRCRGTVARPTIRALEEREE
jgi:hypothetical protein